jgi:hypothetical protein
MKRDFSWGCEDSKNLFSAAEQGETSGKKLENYESN